MAVDSTSPFLLFWTVMIFASIFWYGFLLFYIGFKGGREIKSLIKSKERQ
jgi:hypothetical protein